MNLDFCGAFKRQVKPTAGCSGSDQIIADQLAWPKLLTAHELRQLVASMID